jgi:hypothetical protein
MEGSTSAPPLTWWQKLELTKKCMVILINVCNTYTPILLKSYEFVEFIIFVGPDVVWGRPRKTFVAD